MTFSGFKLPHYLNIIFPATAVLTAAHLLQHWGERKRMKPLLVTQVIICALCLLAAGIINVWAFPVTAIIVVIAFLLLALLAMLFLRSATSVLQKLVGASVVTSTVVFFLLNSNFYQQLLTYQAGNELARNNAAGVNPKDVFFWPGVQSHSYNFYAKELRKEFADSLLQNHQPIWIAIDNERLPQLQQRNWRLLDSVVRRDYEITLLQLPFINPATRTNELDTLQLIRVR